MVGNLPSLSPTTQGQAISWNIGPSPSQHHPGTTIPPSPSLVHFPDFTATSSCQFFETDLGQTRMEVQGEPSIDPMAAEVAVVVGKSIGCSDCKRAKLAAQTGSPDAFFGSPQVVQVFEDYTTTAAASPPRRVAAPYVGCFLPAAVMAEAFC
ncbi:hypothetical protein D5086_021447 [Populus alba]|uniref:Uncharacterized protein n=1 Tax=Populus alba TaxID=43335 RepID=A0ACC4BC74_POPAL